MKDTKFGFRLSDLKPNMALLFPARSSLLLVEVDADEFPDMQRLGLSFGSID